MSINGFILTLAIIIPIGITVTYFVQRWLNSRHRIMLEEWDQLNEQVQDVAKDIAKQQADIPSLYEKYYFGEKPFPWDEDNMQITFEDFDK